MNCLSKEFLQNIYGVFKQFISIHFNLFQVGSTLRHFLCVSFLVFSLTSCASSPMIQPQINSLVIGEQFDYAINLLENNQENYGERNRFLYLLDYGLVLHYAKRYEESIRVFEEAKKAFDSLYTTSLTNEAATWIINDNTAPYRGEDFERVMIHVFQAINYAMLNNIEEALVEARQVDMELQLLNRRYKPEEQNVFKEDGFARLLMGILYETSGTSHDLNNAYISYAKAFEIYQSDFSQHYGLSAPEILKENLLAAAKWMGVSEFNQYREDIQGVDFVDIAQKQRQAEIYLFHYQGLAPIKHGTFIPVPLPGGYLGKLAFPYYEKRSEDFIPGTLKVVGPITKESQTQLGEDIGEIAIHNLENRKFRVIAKALIRSGVKYTIENILEDQIRAESKVGANAFVYISSLYNLISEQPDLRSWQTLPNKIGVARLILKPGDYQIFFNERDLGSVNLKAGEKRFFFVRTTR